PCPELGDTGPDREGVRMRDPAAVSVPGPRRGPRRWPQTFRVRLTLLFAALFLAAGAALLGINYVLAVSQPDNVPPVTDAQAKLAFHCKLGKGPLPNGNCAQALSALGAHEAAAGLRRPELGRLPAYPLG